MKAIIFTEHVYLQLEKYISHYKQYYIDRYDDTGIWSEGLILQQYEKEAHFRYSSILDTIEYALENPYVSFLENIAIIPWKQKILKVTFSELEDTRIIENLEIQ